MRVFQKSTFLIIFLISLIGVSFTGRSITTQPTPTTNHIIQTVKNQSDSLESTRYPFATYYPSINELYTWYNSLTQRYPEICKKIKIGESWKGRPIWVLKVSDNVEKDENEPEVLIDGNIHAREWSTHQVASYFLWKLLDEYNSNNTIHRVVNRREIFILPMLNPDGYYYDGNGTLSQSPGEYGWRKNARDNNDNGQFDLDEDGVDLNRNWNIHWGEKGASRSQDANTYCGPAAFSEPETENYKRWILSRDIESYHNLHSHAGTLLIPWAYTEESSPHNQWYRTMATDMTSLTSKLGSKNEHYTYGQPAEEIGYSASGGAADWVYSETGATGLTFEIYTGGVFHPPKNTIMKINKDLYDALLYQTRIANIDLGTKRSNLHPPAPYIVHGTVTKGRIPNNGTLVTLTNENTGASISSTTDENGYYELNLGALTTNGYSSTDMFNLSIGYDSHTFTIDDTWGQKINFKTVPTARFTVDPLSGTINTVYRFNASISWDDQDPLHDIRVRWDWKNDGTWDTGWSKEKTITHKYENNGTYTIKLQVKDSDEFTDTYTKQVTVKQSKSPKYPPLMILAISISIGVLILLIVLFLWSRR